MFMKSIWAIEGVKKVKNQHETHQNPNSFLLHVFDVEPDLERENNSDEMIRFPFPYLFKCWPKSGI